MKSTSAGFVPLVCWLVLSPACLSKKEEAVEGAVAPPCAGVRITVSQSGKTDRPKRFNQISSQLSRGFS